MEIIKKSKEVILSVLPIVLIATVLGFIFGAFDTVSFLLFIFSSLSLVIGLTFFLFGVDMAFLPVGNQLGAKLTEKKSVPLLLISGLVLGVLVTIAEPDIRVLAGQVSKINSSIDSTAFVMVVALGVGIFMAISYIRALSGISMKIFMAIFIFLMIALSLFLPEFFTSISFDAGGATTGPLAVPFILALGVGVSSVHGNREEDSFGFTGIASIGPVLAVMIYSLFLGKGNGEVLVETSSESLFEIFITVLKSVSSSLLPIAILSLISIFFIFKLPKIRTIKIIVGLFYSFFGIVLFLFAVESAFMPVARTLGGLIASSNPALLVVLGFILGAVVVLAEPAIWVLTEEVEDKSQGKVKKSVMLTSMALGVATAVSLSMVRIITGVHILFFIVPIYSLILILLPFVPPLFAGIAFDSGGVATGPMSSTFLLPLISGASFIVAQDPGSMAFGMIGLIAVMPILAIEIMGVIFGIKIKKEKGEEI